MQAVYAAALSFSALHGTHTAESLEAHAAVSATYNKHHRENAMWPLALLDSQIADTS